MAGNGRRTKKTQLLENHLSGNDHLFDRIFHVASEIDQTMTPVPLGLQRALKTVASLGVFARCALMPEIGGKRPDIARDGHLVVVQNHHHGRLQLSGMIERLKRHATRKSRIANDRDDLFIATAQVARHGKTERHRH